MCDTIVALSNSTIDGSVIFAKNSDRQVNEPHIMIRVPEKKHNKGEKLKCTYIEIDEAMETYEVLLLKPSWIWGCEMGANTFGLNIGNEAVFTKEKYGPPSLTGMDLVRIALERCKTSDEALDTIINLLQRYGQGGNCGYEKQFTYHNSFLIADRNSAWVLETSGIYWAAEKVRDVRSISNCLSIGNKFDLCHPELVSHAISKGWCNSESDFNFAKCYTNALITRFSGAYDRLKSTNSALQREKGHISIETMKKMLRCHHDNTEGRQFKKASLKSTCMHGGFIVGDHTTGSYVASLKSPLDTYYVTGSSTPCISIFKPLWLIKNETLTFSELEKDKAIEYWTKREKLHRFVLSGSIKDLSYYLEARDRIEEDSNKLIANIKPSETDNNVLLEIMNSIQQEEEQLVDEIINSSSYNPSGYRGNLYFRHFWRSESKKLNIR